MYWDSCNWIGLINEDPGKIEPLRYIYQQGQNGEIEIFTSTFALAEVFRLKCEDSEKQLPEEKDQIFEETLDQDFVVYVQLTREIGRYARRLLRRTEGLRVPQDAIHLASAAWHNVDELQTFDGNHLLHLDGKVERRDGQKLKICTPQVPPAQGEMEEILKQPLEQPTKSDDSKKDAASDEKSGQEEKTEERTESSTTIEG